MDKKEYKLVVVGGEGVGKTAFIKRHLTGEFIEKYRSTIGVQVDVLKFNTNVGQVSFVAWDVAGSPKFAGISQGYLVGADCGIIMFDVTTRMSYKEVPNHYINITNMVNNSIPIVLCGNKVDEKDRKVKPSQITYHRKKNLQYYDISVKSNYNYEKPILKLIQLLKNDATISFSESQSLLPVDSSFSPTESYECTQTLDNDEDSQDLDRSILIDEPPKSNQGSFGNLSQFLNNIETSPSTSSSSVFGSRSSTSSSGIFSSTSSSVFGSTLSTSNSGIFGSTTSSSISSSGVFGSNQNSNSFNSLPSTSTLSDKNEFKLVIVGEARVGKSTFVNRQNLNSIDTNNYIPTIGVNVFDLNFDTTVGPIKFQTWDIAGDSKLCGMVDGYLIGADCAIIMFDVTNRDSYKEVPKWYQNLVRVLENIPIVLCGNKVDEKDRKVKPSEIIFHRKKNLQYYDISALTNYNYEKPFLKLIQLLKGDPSILLVQSPSILAPSIPFSPKQLESNSDNNSISNNSDNNSINNNSDNNSINNNSDNNSINNNNDSDNDTSSSIPILENHFNPDSLNDSFKSNFNIN